MKKVKEYLDEYLFPIDKSIVQLRDNGHYGVFGSWIYPRDWKGTSLDEWAKLSDKILII